MRIDEERFKLYRNPKDMYIQASKYIKTLEDLRQKYKKAKESKDMMDIISVYCQENRLLRYKYQPRLLNETQNAQIDEDWR